MSIMDYNGSAMVAMAGKNCVALATDMRFGIQQQTVEENMERVVKVHDNLLCGFTG
jgi:20S proteasome subunit beta 3